MIILLLFAFLAGVVTVLSPCILPVLPLLLAAGIVTEKYKPYGIIIGLIASFTFFTLALTAVVHATGISPNILRYISITLIIFFGLTMVFPFFERLLNTITAPLARLGNRFESSANIPSNGFFSGFILGSALGLIWSPCAGPILATITTLAATGAVSWQAFVVTFSYSLGTALPMFFIIYGGSKISSSISFLTPYTELIRKIFGVLMIVGALAIAFHLDTKLQQFTARFFPTIKIEDNALVSNALEQLQKGTTMQNISPAPTIGARAPEFVGIEDWINSPALTITQLAGKVVLVDFWTYSCINCVRTLPHLKRWYESYQDKGFVIVGVHTPEFAFEKSLKNVADAVQRFGITYPVALDSNFSTWRNYHNRYWPAHYLIDQQGIIQYIHYGEGEYEATENKIRSLLQLAPISEKKEALSFTEQTPELYLGYQRADHYTPELTIVPDKETTYSYRAGLSPDTIGLVGDWLVTAESLEARGANAQLTLNFVAQQVYLVMSAKQPAALRILLDGKDLPATLYTHDMNKKGELIVDASRMYTLINLPNPGRHLLTLEVPSGVSLYAFTFGQTT